MEKQDPGHYTHNFAWVLFLHKFAELRKFADHIFHKFVQKLKMMNKMLFFCTYAYKNPQIYGMCIEIHKFVEKQHPRCYFSTKYGRPYFAELA